jgi:tryptophan-rich sensory protein
MSKGLLVSAQLVACLVVCFMPGVFGSRFVPGAWYEALDKPLGTPPGWVFPVVWTALYAAMGVALFLALRAAPAGALKVPLALFATQLVLNGAWSWLFFGLQRPGLAAVEIVLLWLLIVASTVSFWRLTVAAGALLVPYLLWVGYATYLNLGLWLLNRSP